MNWSGARRSWRRAENMNSKPCLIVSLQSCQVVAGAVRYLQGSVLLPLDIKVVLKKCDFHVYSAPVYPVY